MPKRIARALESTVARDLEKKFVLLSGPRQVGKTTLARSIISARRGLYLVYDDADDRQEILRRRYVHRKWVCLDEFHKFPRWKAHVKGIFDKHSPDLHLLLTGSARLDVYQKSGDSLLGRYYLHHLHPFTLGELQNPRLPGLPDPESLLTPAPGGRAGFTDLLRFGGFPEPLFAQSVTEHRRWSNMRKSLLVQEDLRDLTEVKLLRLAEHLLELIPERIGSLFSANALAEVIQVSTPTVLHWMEIFSRLFIVFKVLPYSRSIGRALVRQPKIYFWDWSQVPDEGARFENLVAGHLFKAARQWTDIGAGNVDLFFVRDRDGREVDFLMVRDGRPWFLVEAKVADTAIPHSLAFFAHKLDIPGILLVQKRDVFRRQGNLLVTSADQWLAHLP